jgi:hypothetical protein
MSEIEYMWPIPNIDAIKVYCWMKMLDPYEIARLSRLNIIERPSQRQNHRNYNSKMAQEEWIRFMQNQYNRTGTTNNSSSNNTWSFA